MSSSYDSAIEELYRAPLASFVAERKRLAAALKAGGDAAAAQRLAKATRPTVSAWVVNQLWWTQRAAFERLLATAKDVRVGDAEALAAHREVIAELREHAAALLGEGGRGASEAMLRRVSTTLGALAATGGFAPDPQGALSADRDPPGFEAALRMLADTPESNEEAGAPRPQREREQGDTDEKETAAQKKRAEAERKRREAEQRRIEAERTRLTAALEKQQREVTAREQDVTRLREELAAAERRLTEAKHKQTAMLAELDELEPSATP